MRGWGVRMSVGWWFLVRVHLDVQRQTFYAFLTGEIGAETLYRHVDLQRREYMKIIRIKYRDLYRMIVAVHE